MKVKLLPLAAAAVSAFFVFTGIAGCTQSQPHVHNFTNYVVQEPDCVNEGSMEQVCADCGEKIYSDIQPLGHKYVNGICERCGQSDGTAQPEPTCEHEYDVTVVSESDCTEAGSIKLVCSKCGDESVAQVPALGHKYVNGICTRCGQSDGTVSPVCEHEYDAAMIAAPDCTEAGSIKLVCSKCGDESVVQVPALGHKYVNGVCERCGQSDGTVSPVCEHEYGATMIAAPDCTEAGSIKLVCSKCGDESVMQVPALGHKYVNGVCERCGQSDGTVSPVCEHEYGATMIAAPDCTEAGSIKLVCSKCGDESVMQVPALGHKYVNGVCERCGQSDGSDPDIPDDPELLLFTDIDEAYSYSQELGYPFSETDFINGMRGMRFTEVFTNSNGHLKVKYGAISADIGDVRVDIPTDGAAHVGLINSIEISKDGALLISDTTGKLVDFGRLEPFKTAFGEYVVGAAINFQNELLLLKNDGTIVKAGFISKNSSVEVVDDLLLYREYWFSYSVDGAFNRNIEYADVAPTHLGKPVTSVASDAFAGYLSLRGVVLPEGIEQINNRAFKDCSALEYIVLPESLYRISANAFEGCSSLDNIFYCGTKTQWAALNIVLSETDATVYFYSDVGPVIGENYWHYDEEGNPVIW